MRSFLWLFAGAAALALTPACSSSSAGAGSDDAGPSTMSSEDSGPPNPNGVAYPTDHIGTNARKASIAGSRIQNFTFQGYADGDTSKPIQTISMSDYYDPDGKLGYKLLHLGVAAVWCVPCNAETDATVPLVAMYKSMGVVFMQALDNGTMLGVAATPGDLTSWITKHKVNFTEVLDPNAQDLGMFFDASAVPWNAIIDPRSMEILEDGTGFSGNIQSDLAPWISWVASNKPSY